MPSAQQKQQKIVPNKTKLMGILNVTPDSFFDGGQYQLVDAAVKQAKRLEEEGADIIDIGGESTRPGSLAVDAKEEMRRVIPVIRALSSELSIPLSIDTKKPEVAEEALKNGATIINDVSGFCDPLMSVLAKEFSAQAVVMHMLGEPKTMQKDPKYPCCVIDSLVEFFEKRVNLLLKAGMKESQIILDPGIGFGKTVEDNQKIIQNLARLKQIGFPLLIGLSRKSFLGKNANERLPGTIALNAHCIRDGVDYIRVHDVKEHRTAIDQTYEVFCSRH